ncbi:MAG: metallophosphoesterase [PVC group bacterium]
MRNRRCKMLVIGAVAVAAAAAVFWFILFDALVLEPNWIVVERVVIEDEVLARALGGLAIAQISDLHLRGKLGFREEELIRKLNRLSPDIIVFTGDLVEDGTAAPLAAEFIRRLKPALWCYGILGNADRRYLSGETYRENWKRSGLSLIGGKCLPMGGKGEGIFWLGGIDFPGYEAPGMEEEIDRIMEEVPPGAPLIFLSYDPDLAPLLIRKGADLVLSGDTHGGLIGLPGWPKIFHRFFRRTSFIRGLFAIDGGILYVNRGIAPKGLPLRFLCPPEITLFQFK